MPYDKTNESNSTQAFNFFQKLPTTMAGIIAGYLPMNDFLKLIRTNKGNHALFRPHLLSQKARACVVQGDVDTLIIVAQKDPNALFQKGTTTDPRGRRFYNASAYQLIHFLCDVDMKQRLLPYIPATFKTERNDQVKELGRGGADLVKLDRSPLSLDKKLFNGLRQFKQRFNIFDGTPRVATFPLLENVDGIIYYEDENAKAHFYFVRRESGAITLLEPNLTSQKNKQLLDALIASFEPMEMNSSRRSSDEEHQWIETLFGGTLHREGIHYEYRRKYYQDSRTPFHLINAYRKSARLFEEASQNKRWDKADKSWCEEVGLAQGEEMWVLLCICAENLPFYPSPPDFNGFKRGFVYYDSITNIAQKFFSAGKLISDLGSDFALCKDSEHFGMDHAGSGGPADLVVVNRLIEDAKATILNPTPEQAPDIQASGPR